MELLTRAGLGRLMQEREQPCVSLFLPTHRAGSEVQQDRIRLKNVIRDAHDRLVQTGVRSAEADRMLQPVRDLLDDGLFWRHQEDGLAIFRSPGLFAHYRVPLQFGQLVVFAERFHVKPFLPLLTEDGIFYVLALSQNNVRFLRGSRFGVREIDVPGMPRSLKDALRYDEFEKQLQYHTDTEPKVGERPAVFHGHSLKDEEKSNLVRYFRQIDKALHALLHDERVPLVLGGTAFLFPIYREANT